ncbi:MAG: hypothetical protein KGL59_11805 [Acidobacteriota bacterium]|nr:hypothetical protein [Acidobacteriota bacterium]
MRRFSFVADVGICALIMSGTLFAQEQKQTQEEQESQTRAAVEVTRADIQSDRQALVASNLPLTDEQAKAFWPLYRQYRAEMQTVGDRLVNLVENYGQNYESLTDEQAAQMMKEYLNMQKDTLAIKDKYVPRFTKILPAKTVMRFYQIENKMDLIVMLAVSSQIPLAK